jgi:putative transposase
VGDRRGNAGEEGDAAMLSVVADEQARAELRVGLDELAREGARRMLAAALEAEVDDYLAEHAAERDEHGRRLVVRNGHARQREVTTAAGAISVRAPRVDDRRTDPVSGAAARPTAPWDAGAGGGRRRRRPWAVGGAP